ncbi:MAG: gliding motility-associated C-terminal domain-containing protein, partial [Ferruginibacter sp.]|nr:gliding motility-associated C-terminal domain-containing protein [Ferruginibacter sp.]
FINNATLPAPLTIINSGGTNGVLTTAGNDPWGATGGTNGTNIFNLLIPISTQPFKPNIDSVKIALSSTSCNGFTFNGLAFTNTYPITTWQWNFGDGTTATGQTTTHTYANTNTFPVTLVVTDINGCKDSVVKNIVSSAISLDAGLDKSFCGVQNSFPLNAVATANSTISYSWTSTPTTSIINNNSANATAIVTNTTTFFVTATDIQGCTNIDSVKVIINPLPIVKTLVDTSICKGSSLQLTTTAGLNTYQWTNGFYVSDSTIANPFFTDTLSQILVVTGYNGFCYAKDTIQVTVKANPIVKTIADTMICSTQSILLTTTGANTYSWSPNIFLNNNNSPAPTFMGNIYTTYIVTGTAANGCTGKDTVNINVNIPNSFVQPPSKSFCIKEFVVLDGYNGIDAQYNWTGPNLNNSNIINPTANPLTSTNYQVSIFDRYCNTTQNFIVPVNVLPLPIITTEKSNDVNCIAPSAELLASGAIKYLWSPAQTLNDSTIKNPLATPNITTTYTVIGTDNNGCVGKNTITVSKDNSFGIVDLPNIFTPNNDGKNDCFRILVKGQIKNYTLMIFNRWGEKVFETQNSNDCWNGKYKAMEVETGNYVYYLTAKTLCGAFTKKGNVLLIR